MCAPVLTGIELRAVIGDVDHALGCTAVLIEVDAQILTIGFLCLTDSHAHRDTDVQMQLA